MGNCPSSSLKELFEEVTSNENKQNAAPVSSGTPDRITLIDPRSPLVDAERTPVEVLFKSSADSHVSDETDEVTTDDSHHHRRLLNDPRSATAGISRTPILVESPLELNSDNAEAPVEDSAGVDDRQEFPKPAITDTPVLPCDVPQKVVAVAKKLTFDVSPSPRKVKTAEVTVTARSRAPLSRVRGNTPTGSHGTLPGRRLSAKVKAQRPMSPLQLLQVRQRLAVKRVLQLNRTQVEVEGENCPPTNVEAAQCDPAVRPIKVSVPPALPTKDMALRF
ncbi:uncharacterized protein LOC126295330 [Schistocerca gregaria]|uniref:uncharacterized protein LOC126295330 n=1 Tax=Schistocerca gregaria TaxID=7010 RepID=UPI00211E2D36|nr:uncharacterized protein LOC126295330 [Schistocerca gregaria]XP_049843755.1 uncharacterized protein LOC126295330 [Schistocerca gregaria]